MSDRISYADKIQFFDAKRAAYAGRLLGPRAVRTLATNLYHAMK